MLPTVRDTVRRFGVGSVECRQSSLDELPEFGKLGAYQGDSDVLPLHGRR
jgi:hypothetical protein